MTKSIYPVKISGVGKGLPETVIKNVDLEKLVETTDEWISSRSGIKERRIVSGEETSSQLAAKAGKDALEFAGISSKEVDLIICATSIPDHFYPSTACEVQKELEASNAAAFDVVAACSGLIYGLNIARNFIMTGTYKTVLVVGVDVHSRAVDWSDRSTCVLFGDGAGAMVLTRSEEKDDILEIKMQADGSKGMELRIPVSSQNCPIVEPKTTTSGQFVHMNGREIYKFAVNTVPVSINNTIDSAGVCLEDVDNFILHQANVRIIEAISDKLNVDKDKFFMNLQKYGNTSAASIAIALTEAVEQNVVKPDSTIVISGFGAGLTWGSAVINWSAEDKRLS